MPNENNLKHVILIRHAQSTWNAETRFTGWADPPLTELGISEAEKAGALLTEANIKFDHVYTSALKRAQQTAQIIMETTQQSDVNVTEDWRLNERHYGQLQGLNKVEMAEKVGEEQVLKWRRGYLDKPDPLPIDDSRHPRFDAKYQHIDASRLPSAENLAETRARAMEFWTDTVVPAVQRGESLLISSHGNTLRGLIMALSDMSAEEVETFEIPTGVPIIYHLNDDGTANRWGYIGESIGESTEEITEESARG